MTEMPVLGGAVIGIAWCAAGFFFFTPPSALCAKAAEATSDSAKPATKGTLRAMVDLRPALDEAGPNVSAAPLPPCNGRLERQDANQLWQIGSHIWSTI